MDFDKTYTQHKELALAKLLREGNSELLRSILYNAPDQISMYLIQEYLTATRDTKTIDMDITLLSSTGTKYIPLIKLYRQLTGVGLKEAKDHVDNLLGRRCP